MPVTEKQMDKYIKVSTNENKKIFDVDDQLAQFGYGIRHAQMGIIFMSFIARGHLGVTIVAITSHHKMTNFTENIAVTNASDDENITAEHYADINKEIDNIFETTDADVERTIYRTYYWSKPVQEAVLSSFFLGYCLMMLPMALVCQRWGGKVPLQIALIVNGLVSFLTPWLTLWGDWKALSACRLVQGLAQAGMYPGIQTLIANWVPINERAILSSFVYTGATIGNIIGFQLSGILSESWGWPAIFWAVGVLCLICFVFLTVFGTSTPLVHKTISKEEKRFIMGNITRVVQRRRTVPWKAILTSRAVWANLVTHIGAGAAYVFVLTQAPSFIHYTLGVDVKDSGVLSSIPYMASFFSTIGFGYLSDYLTNRKILSLKSARRIFYSVSQVGVAGSLICASYATTTTVAVFCFTVTMSCYTGIHSGWMLNHIDLSPNYSGTLMAIGNTLMNIFVVIIPILVSNIVVDVRNPSQWRIMLCTMAGIAFLGNIVFVFFLSAEVQPWDEGQIDDAEAEDLKQKPVKEDELKLN